MIDQVVEVGPLLDLWVGGLAQERGEDENGAPTDRRLAKDCLLTQVIIYQRIEGNAGQHSPLADLRRAIPDDLADQRTFGGGGTVDAQGVAPPLHGHGLPKQRAGRGRGQLRPGNQEETGAGAHQSRQRLWLRHVAIKDQHLRARRIVDQRKVRHDQRLPHAAVRSRVIDGWRDATLNRLSARRGNAQEHQHEGDQNGSVLAHVASLASGCSECNRFVPLSQPIACGPEGLRIEANCAYNAPKGNQLRLDGDRTRDKWRPVAYFIGGRIYWRGFFTF